MASNSAQLLAADSGLPVTTAIDRSSLTPPALPVKQRRSQPSSTSSVSDLQLAGETYNLYDNNSAPNSPFTEVFATPTDCHAVRCPIHRYGHHKERFFSDETPPPIPKKKLIRTHSLPTVSQRSPAQQQVSPHQCENSHCETEVSPVHYAGEGERENVLKTHYLNQFNLETPDQKLPEVFDSFSHQEQVYVSIKNCYLQFMRRAVRHLEAMVLLEEQETEKVRRLQPEDCLLCKDEQPKKIDQEVFFTVNVSKIPTRFLSAKVNIKGSELMPSKTLPHHPNTEEIIACFPPCMAEENQQLSELPASVELSQEGSTEPCHKSTSITKGSTVLSFIERGCTITIVRDFPWGTLEDFVKEGVYLHRLHPDVYERRLCLLMLQLVQGLGHLETHDVKHRELAPQRIMLVWWCTKNKGAAEKAEVCAEPKSMMKREGFLRDSDADRSERLEGTHYENVSMRKVDVLWRRWGTPRVVISHDGTQAECSRDATSKELQVRRLLKHCLHQCADTNRSTQYTRGLHHLLQQLTSEAPGFRLADVAGVLQAVLWGPRAGLFEKNQASTVTVHNWLTVKRTLLVLKLAEKGLLLNQNVLDWEDYLCLQYLSSADPEAILETAVQLGLHNPMKTALMANTNMEMQL